MNYLAAYCCGVIIVARAASDTGDRLPDKSLESIPMKLGIILSLALVILIAIVAVVLNYSPADTPTNRTAPDKLQIVGLPANLPAMYNPTKPEAGATPLYHSAIDFYNQSHRAFSQGGSSSLNDQLARLLIDAMNAGQANAPIADSMIPMKPKGESEVNDTLWGIPGAVLTHAASLRDGGTGDKALALQCCQAVFAFGERLFRNSKRLPPRIVGLAMMRDAGDVMYSLLNTQPSQQAGLAKWADAIKAIESNWTPKNEQILGSVKPPVADLIRLAKEDQDASFRVEATLMLGVAKFNAGTKGNLAAIEEAIAELKADSNPMIAEAAAAAEAYTVEELRRLR